MIKVLMIDDNESLVEMVKEYFKDNKEISIELVAYNGLEGITKIEKEQNKTPNIQRNIKRNK